MNKISLLFLGLVFILASAFTSTEYLSEEKGVWIEIPVNESMAPNDWGSWTSSNCYRYLDFRVKNRGQNYDKTKYKWGVQFKNRYNEKIYFSYEVYDSRPNNPRTTNRMDVKSGAQSDGMRDFYMKSGSSIYVYVDKVRFGKDGLQEYYKCDK